jgi:hypothetical protein
MGISLPGAGRFAVAPFAGQRFGVNRFNNFAFRRSTLAGQISVY